MRSTSLAASIRRSSATGCEDVGIEFSFEIWANTAELPSKKHGGKFIS
jgi:hypothetical protein